MHQLLLHFVFAILLTGTWAQDYYNSSTSSGNPHSFSSGAAAGIGVGAGVAVTLIVIGLGFLLLRQRRRKAASGADRNKDKEREGFIQDAAADTHYTGGKPELPASSVPVQELDTWGREQDRHWGRGPSELETQEIQRGDGGPGGN